MSTVRGIPLPFFKSAAKRPPTPAPAAAEPPVADGPLTVETLGQQLREVLPARRLQSVSLCDHEANVLWLSEGALGPDEHSLVTEALMLLTADPSLPSHEIPLEDGRLALFLPVRAPNGSPVGIAMILADRKSVGDDTLERITAAPVRAIMQRLAVLLKPTAVNVGSGTQPIPVLDFDEALSEAPAAPAAAKSCARAPAAPVAVTPVAFAAAPGHLRRGDRRHPRVRTRPRSAAGCRSARRGASLCGPTASSRARRRGCPRPVQIRWTCSILSSRSRRPRPARPRAPRHRRAAAAAAPAVAAPPRVVPTLAPVARVAAARTAAGRAAVRPPRPARRPRLRSWPPVRARRAQSRRAVARRPERPAVLSSEVLEASEAAVNDPNLVLELLPFAKLRAGGQTRRFQVLARSPGVQRDPAAFDALVLQRLLGWLAAHRASWNSQPTSFTVNLSIATLEDERFAQKIAAALNTHGIAAETIGFEIAEALCTQRRAQVERFITACGKVGSWVVIDDFSFDSQVLTLLRSKALRLVKIDSKLTSSALKDKLSQAMVVATVQASKVLGIHCAAKRVDSQAQLQWLTAIGCDFAQGHALARAQELDSLASSPDPTGISALALPS